MTYLGRVQGLGGRRDIQGSEGQCGMNSVGHGIDGCAIADFSRCRVV